MENYQEILKGFQSEMIQTLKEIVAIKSVVSPAEGELPFGQDVEKAFRYMMNKSEAMSFRTFDAQHYGGHAEMGEGEECMGILAHLDVVPEGEDWKYDPFAGEIVDGKMYGRGTNDDKGPAVAALYAMKAIMDSGAPLKKRVRLVYGLDEEAGEWQGIDKYLEMAGEPDFGFTPDADFPLVHAEMGILIFDLVKKFKKAPKEGIILKSLQGGRAYNMIADKCSAVITTDNNAAVKDKVKAFRDRTGYEIDSKPKGRSLEIITEGVPGHGARPETGLNAISIMMLFLSEINFGNDDINDFIAFYNSKIGFNLHGKNIGAGLSDDVSGDLIWNTGLVKLNEEMGSFTINVRYPVTGKAEDVYEGMASHLDESGFGVVKGEHKAGIYIPKDSRIVTTLMDIYRKHTGDMESEPMVVGGGTYARAMKNAVAYGIKFPGEPATEHQKDEFIDISNMMKGAAIYADAIYRLCCEE